MAHRELRRCAGGRDRARALHARDGLTRRFAVVTEGSSARRGPWSGRFSARPQHVDRPRSSLGVSTCDLRLRRLRRPRASGVTAPERCMPHDGLTSQRKARTLVGALLPPRGLPFGFPSLASACAGTRPPRPAARATITPLARSQAPIEAPSARATTRAIPPRRDPARRDPRRTTRPARPATTRPARATRRAHETVRSLSSPCGPSGRSCRG